MSKALVLDTHVWLWLLAGDSQLSQKAAEQIQESAKQRQVFISAITIWEVGMLAAKGRIQLLQDCLQWVQQALSAPGIRLVPLTPEIAIGSTNLPSGFYGDPANRIIVATARHLGATLITKDKKILTYSDTGHIQIVQA